MNVHAELDWACHLIFRNFYSSQAWTISSCIFFSLFACAFKLYSFSWNLSLLIFNQDCAQIHLHLHLHLHLSIFRYNTTWHCHHGWSSFIWDWQSSILCTTFVASLKSSKVVFLWFLSLFPSITPFLLCLLPGSLWCFLCVSDWCLCVDGGLDVPVCICEFNLFSVISLYLQCACALSPFLFHLCLLQVSSFHVWMDQLLCISSCVCCINIHLFSCASSLCRFVFVFFHIHTLCILPLHCIARSTYHHHHPPFSSPSKNFTSKQHWDLHIYPLQRYHHRSNAQHRIMGFLSAGGRCCGRQIVLGGGG